ncbi:MAG: TetR/AcrR family transcriptional regulator [Thermodesulfobacteriota bacterium]
MARSGGDKTRRRILAAAEKIFSTRGFDATSVDRIARTAGVNKALIYYHFKNKNDLILKLFESIIEEVAVHVESQTDVGPSDNDMALKRKIQDEVEFLAERSRILSVMLAEALRSNQRDDFLFRCAEMVIQREHGREPVRKVSGVPKRPARRHMVHEFFTGFVPLVAFVALRDKWCQYFNYSPKQVTGDFIEAFAESHLASPMKQG